MKYILWQNFGQGEGWAPTEFSGEELVKRIYAGLSGYPIKITIEVPLDNLKENNYADARN